MTGKIFTTIGALKKDQKGEIALVLTLISAALILVGIGTGVAVIKSQVSSSIVAQNRFKAADTPCPALATYTPSSKAINPVGPKIATNFTIEDLQQVRSLYNCRYPAVGNFWIPVTIIFPSDQDNFNKSDTLMKQKLDQMYSLGLYPIIRIASQYSGDHWLKIGIGPGTNDADLIGQALAKALNQENFPDKPIVYFGNEVNLDAEWGGQGQADPANYADSLNSFIAGMDKESGGSRGKYKIYFTPLSYGGGRAPGQFIIDLKNRFKTQNYQTKLDGAAFTIYEANIADVNTQFTRAQSDITPSGGDNTIFNTPTEYMITELGPNPLPQGNSPAEMTNWASTMAPIFQAKIANPGSWGNFVTTAYFDSSNAEHLVAAYPSMTSADIVCFAKYLGSIPNDCSGSTTPPPGAPTSPPGVPTSPPGGGGGGNWQNTPALPIANPNPNGDPQINFAPTNPQAGDTVHIGSASDNAFKNVYMQGNAGSGNLINFPQDASQPVVCINQKCNSGSYISSLNPSNKKYLWIYTTDNISAGTWTFTFYANCTGTQGVGCSQQNGATLAVGGQAAQNANPTTAGNGPTRQPQRNRNIPEAAGYTNKDYEIVIKSYAAEEISPLSVSAWLSQATRYPGLQTAICYPPKCDF